MLKKLVIAAWAVVIAGGALAVAEHDVTPGPPAAAHLSDAAPAGLGLVSGTWNIVMFIHPRCPCSAASLAELAGLSARCGDRLHTSIVIFRPTDKPDRWVHTPTYEAATHLAGATVKFDEDAAIARRMGAFTSGQAFVYDPAGRLAFSGGMTNARDCSGDSVGVERVAALVLQTGAPKGPVSHAAVFGCRIDSPYQGEYRLMNRSSQCVHH
jgi:hypothetical protein